jgi:hypothetical protein
MDPKQPQGRSGTWIVIAILALATVIGVGRGIIKKVGDRFVPPESRPTSAP